MEKSKGRVHVRLAVRAYVALVFAAALLPLLPGGLRGRGRARLMPAPGVAEAEAAAGAAVRAQPKCSQSAVTVAPGFGRFGNQFMEVASAWAVARASGLRLATPERLRKAMMRAFRRAPLGLPLAALLRSCTVVPADTPDRLLETIALARPHRLNDSALDDTLRRAGEHKLMDLLVVIKEYAVSSKFLAPLMQELRGEFQFHEHLRERAQAVLRDLRARAAKHRFRGDRQWPREDPIYVSVHARRTDYLAFLIMDGQQNPFTLVDYFVAAVSRLRRDIQADGGVATPLVLVVLSDDMQWVRRKLVPALRRLDGAAGAVDAFAAGGGTPLQDLALLAACNHSIISYGTYGSTGALLAGGRVIAYKLSTDYFTSVFRFSTAQHHHRCRISKKLVHCHAIMRSEPTKIK